MKSSTYVCVPCRTVARGNVGRICPHCREQMTATGTRWRPPRRLDKNAWDRIARGDWATENAKLDSVTVRETTRRQASRRVGQPIPRPSSVAPYTWAMESTAARVVLAALDNGPTTAEVAALARHHDAAVRIRLAGTEGLPVDVLATLLHDSDPAVQAAAVLNPDLPRNYQVRKQILRAPARARAALARRTDVEPRLLRRLVRDKDPKVAAIAAAHQNTPWDALSKAPLGWVPSTRLAEIAHGPALVLLTDLHATSGQQLSVLGARELVDTILASA